MNSSFYFKYLKYKSKYLNLKKQMGGDTINELNCNFEKFDNQYIRHFDSIITKNIKDNNLTIIINHNDVKIIGSGGFGKIILINSGTADIPDYYVVKLIYKKSNCKSAKNEFNNINRVYEAYNVFLKLDLTQNDLARLITFINPLQAYGYYDCNIKLDNEDTKFNCCLITSYSRGYDVKSKIIPNLDPSFGYIDTLKEDLAKLYETILVMPYVTNEGSYPFIHINNKFNDDSVRLSIENPVRYGQLNVYHLDKLIGNKDYIRDYGKIMGIIQGILLWSAKLTTDDFEILLGPKDESYVYNLIDYGMLNDLTKDVNKVLADKNMDDIDNLLDTITGYGSTFMAKFTFPTTNNIDLLNDFIEYFKITSKLINGVILDDCTYNLINCKLKEKL